MWRFISDNDVTITTFINAMSGGGGTQAPTQDAGRDRVSSLDAHDICEDQAASG